jgi:hypothetical protein
MPGGREPGHVDTDLGDDRLGGPLPDPGDGVEPVTGPLERDSRPAGGGGEDGIDTFVELRGGGLEVGGVIEAEPDEQGVVVPEPARNAWRSSGIFLRSTPLASSARTSGSRSPATRACNIARPETPNTSEATESNLMPASSRVFWIRWHSAVWAWISRLR